MADRALVEVADVDRAIRAGLDIHGAEPAVGRRDRGAKILRLERRADGGALGEHHAALQRLDGEDFAVVFCGQRTAFVDDELCEKRSALLCAIGS